VADDASFAEIQAAYWEKAKSCRDQLPLLNAAYEALGDQHRRASYDEQRRAAVQARPQGLQPAGWQTSRLSDKLGMFLS
jgi:DnaJ-class molecular chaperone